MKIIGVDLCNTAFRINKLLYQHIFGQLTPPKEILGTYGPNMGKDFWTGCVGQRIFRNAQPYPSCVEQLWQLSDCYRLIYLTARPKESKAITESSLFRWKFPPAKIVFTIT